MFKKIKHKLILYFLLFSSFSLIAIIGSVWFYKKKENVSDIVRTLDDINILCLKDFKLQQEFINYESVNQDFFQTNHSIVVDNQNKIEDQIFKKIKKLLREDNIEKLNLIESIKSLQLELVEYRSIINEVRAQIKLRGFVNYGVEGEMRTHAHDLMDLGGEIDQVKILMLRRHEKDFIIRREYQYVDKFDALIMEVQEEIENKPGLSSDKKKQILKTVEDYYLTFNKLVSIEKNLGLKDHGGLMLKLMENISRIEDYIEFQKKFARQMELSIYKELKTSAYVFLIAILVFSLLMSYFVASTITKPIVNLTNYVKGYVSSNFTHFPASFDKSGNYEIEVLKKNFIKMSIEITSHLNYFRGKVEERTEQIHVQKEEILLHQVEIVKQRDQLKIQKEILEIQKKVVMEKNKSMVDSIRYAKRIQQAMLPPRKTIKTILPKSFVYYKPKDIVSGDFYWIDQINSPSILGGVTDQKWSKELHPDSKIIDMETSSNILFAAVDCTGHGVPGAFMSIIGHNGLNKIIQEYKFSEPAAILNQLNKEVCRSLRQKDEGTTINDGMDIALCSLDRGKNILQFAGANNPLYIVRNKEIQVIKGDKFPIGKFMEGEIPLFTNHTVQTQKGDAIYIFSDGYMDQFGGPREKKFKQKQFKEVLLSIQGKKMSEQKIILKNTLEKWQGQTSQVDDILVIGVKI